MKKGFVYKIVSPSGKTYIGSTKQVSRRKYQYSLLCCKNQTKLYASLLKYGFLLHSFEVIWSGDYDEMHKKEREYGIEFNVLDRDLGLNLKLPDDSGKPFMVSPEVGKKIGDKAKIRNIGSGNPFFGKSHSQEFKDNLSAKRSVEYLGANNPNFGKKWTQERKDAQRELVKSKKFKHSQEAKDNQRDRMIGNKINIGRKKVL